MTQAPDNLDWLVQRLCEATPGIRQAVVVSADGLPLAKSEGVDQEAADRLAAVSSGMIGLAYGSAGRFNAGAVSNVIVEMERGWLFVTGIRGGSLICCLTEKDISMSTIAFEMSIFVQRVGQSVTPAARGDQKSRLLGSA